MGKDLSGRDVKVDIAKKLIKKAGDLMTKEQQEELLEAAIAADKERDINNDIEKLVDELMLLVECKYHAEKLTHPVSLAKYLESFSSRLREHVIGMTFNLLAVNYQKAILAKKPKNHLKS